MIAIEVEGVSKRFRLRTIEPATTLKTAVVDLVLGRRRERREPVFQALRDITCTVRRGQTLGIIGRNGSGKSTLLKLIAGIYRPDAGRIRVYGRVAGLLELGAGFHPEFSGRENIFINGIVLGLSKREVRQRFDDIVKFAELGGFIDEPVRTYSSGMYVRLGFAVAVHTDPDILLIDELLAVGDEGFQRKCYEKIGEFQRKGKTMVLVSHDLQAIERWCDETLWLEGGIIREWRQPNEVIDKYLQAIVEWEANARRPAPAIEEGVKVFEENARRGEVLDQKADEAPHVIDTLPAQDAEAGLTAEVPTHGGKRWGSGEVEIVSFRLLDRNGQDRFHFHCGEEVTMEIRYRVHHEVTDVVFGIAVIRQDGLWCYGTNTDIERILLPPLEREGVVKVVLENLGLLEGYYYLDVAVHRKDGSPYDYHSRLYPFSISSEMKDVGIFRIPHRWTIRCQG